MQVVLCAALGVSVSLAWWVSRIHAAALVSRLGPTLRFDNDLLPLDLRVPEGWTVEREAADDTDLALERIRTTEAQAHFGSVREVEVRVQRIRPKVDLPSPEGVANDENSDRVQVGTSERLDFLGNPGVLINYPRSQEETAEGPVTLKPALFACTVLPDVRVAVSLEMVGKPFFVPTPADAALLTSIAKSMSRADLSQKAPPIPRHDDVDWHEKRVKPPTADPGDGND